VSHVVERILLSTCEESLEKPQACADNWIWHTSYKAIGYTDYLTGFIDTIKTLKLAAGKADRCVVAMII
jgi:hypothetical protein